MATRTPATAALDRQRVAYTLHPYYVSAGRRGLQVALAPADLLRVTGATVAPIGRAS